MKTREQTNPAPEPGAEKTEAERECSGFCRFAHDWVRPLVLALLILAPIRSSIADWNDVPSGSMMPTILVGDRIFVNKLAYGLRVPLTRTWVTRWDEPARGSIVICHSPDDDKRLVKRVVAVAGDTVRFHGGELYINGERPSYTRLDPSVTADLSERDLYGQVLNTETFDGVSHAVMHTPGLPRIRESDPIVVPEGKVFVMGDNRDMSQDSRAFGFIDTTQVVGEVGRVVASVDPDHYFLPRFDRFFKKID